ncbi:MAG: CinA family nicotinamide mononucleotide deamidase-related protein [Deltaproteobacteria bacterium]|nr:CinA family nicotinamide mononucleotide deamidase-related protein [Deltaproteobacteria bacterium]
MTRLAEILSQGDEIVTGAVVDTNAAWLARLLEEAGLRVRRHMAVGDDPEAIAAALRGASERAGHVVCTGGLGPTDDDHTALGVSLAFDLPLEERAEALQQVEARYAAFGRALDPSGRRQARLPRGAVLLENRFGTAPGFRLDRSGCTLWFLPGVPREMEGMAREHLEPALVSLGLVRDRIHVVRCVGIGESLVQERLRDLALPPGIRIGWRAMIPEVQVRLRGRPEVPPEVLSAVVDRVTLALGDHVFGVDSGPLEEVIGLRLRDLGQTVATAESCTAGRLAAALTRVPGASAWFLEGAVVYANAAKARSCGVDLEVLAAHGAVSEPVARAMAEGIRARAGSTWGLSTTGIAGPTGGTPEKPVGTVYIAVAGPSGTTQRRLRLTGAREPIMDRTVGAVLDLLRGVLG